MPRSGLWKLNVLALPLLILTAAPVKAVSNVTGSLSRPTPPKTRSTLTTRPSKSGIAEADRALWKKTLDRIAKKSKRGEAAVEMRRLVLASLFAPTEAQQRSIADQIRVKLAAHPGSKRFGRPFEVLSHSVENSARPSRASGPSPAEECTSDWNGVTYVDECYTDEETAQDILYVEALYAESVADYEEAVNLCEARATDPSQCTYITSPSPDHGSLRPMDRVQALPEDASPCAVFEAFAADAGLPNRSDCLNQAMESSVELGKLSAMVGGYMSWINGGKVAARAARFARLGLYYEAFELGWKIGTFINCEMEESPSPVLGAAILR